MQLDGFREGEAPAEPFCGSGSAPVEQTGVGSVKRIWLASTLLWDGLPTMPPPLANGCFWRGIATWEPCVFPPFQGFWLWDFVSQGVALGFILAAFQAEIASWFP
jgi:hypothetical protein